jgi:hypothetical protein
MIVLCAELIIVLCCVVLAGSLSTDKEQRQAAQGSTPAPPATSPIGFWQAFMLPNVLSYAIAFGFFKLVAPCARINVFWFSSLSAPNANHLALLVSLCVCVSLSLSVSLSACMYV